MDTSIMNWCTLRVGFHFFFQFYFILFYPIVSQNLCIGKVLPPQGICTMSILKTFLNVPISPQITNSLHSKCWFSDPVIVQGTCDMTFNLERVHICHIVNFSLSRWIFIYLFVYFFNSLAFPFRLSVFLHTLLFSHYNTYPSTFFLATIHISQFLHHSFWYTAFLFLLQFTFLNFYTLCIICLLMSRFWHLFDWNSNTEGRVCIHNWVEFQWNNIIIYWFKSL